MKERGGLQDAHKARSPADSLFTFFQGFLKHPHQVGSIIPSSRFLERRIVRLVRAATARTVVELGPGTGGTTRALLAAMPADARLLAIEINPDFLALLRDIKDSRLIVHEGDARHLREAIAAHRLPPPDAVVSGIPFSTIKDAVGLEVIRAVFAALAPGGRFVAYQVRDRVEVLGRAVFGPARGEMVLRNIPPVRVYAWEKPAPPTARAGEG